MRGALAAVAVLALAVPAAGAAAAPRTQTILVTSVTIASRSHDVKPAGPSKGDTITVSDHLLNAATQFGRKKGSTVGSDRAVVTLSSATEATIKGNATLPGGTIAISGPITSLANGGLVVAVSGGTGAFAHVHGTLTVGPGKDRVLNTYRLTRSGGFVA
jgi:hypothetical protein